MTTLYEKIGRRYKPAAERDEWDAWQSMEAQKA